MLNTPPLQPNYNPLGSLLDLLLFRTLVFFGRRQSLSQGSRTLGYQWAPYSFFRILSLQFKKSTSFAPYPGTYYLSTSVRMSSSGSFSSQPPVLSVFTGLCPRSQSCQSEFPRDFRKLAAIVNCHWTVIETTTCKWATPLPSFPVAILQLLLSRFRQPPGPVLRRPQSRQSRQSRRSRARGGSPRLRRSRQPSQPESPRPSGLWLRDSRKDSIKKNGRFYQQTTGWLSVWPKMIDPCSNPGN